MTATVTAARVTKTAPVTTAETDKLLRDMAFVLKLTRRVKEEMTADRAPTQTPAATSDRALVA